MKKNYVEAINNILFEADIEDIIFCVYQKDEYIAEARMINDKINEDMSVEEIAEICRDVFNYMFFPNYTTKDFINISEEILKLI